jgi:hypothetical protein
MEDNVVYIESILSLKKHWKVGSDLPPQYRDKPLFAVDFSYKNDGSRTTFKPVMLSKKESPVNLMEELQDDDDAGGEVEGGERVEDGDDKVLNKQIELQLPVTALSKKLRIGDDLSFVDIPFIAPEVEFTSNNSLFQRAVGINYCHNLLFNAQESLFAKEIFETVSKAATSDKKSQIQQKEDEIFLETMSENMFKIQLTSAQVKSNPTSDDMDDNLQNHQQQNNENNMELDGDCNNNSQSELIYKLIGFKLHEGLRKKHLKQQEEDRRPKLTRDFSSPPPDFVTPALDETLCLYRHLQLYHKVKAKLEELCKNIPFFAMRWINTNDRLLQSFEVTHDHNLFIVCVMVRKDQINLSNHKISFGSPQEMASSLVIQSITSIISTINSAALYFFQRENIVKLPDTLVITSKNFILEFKFNVYQTSFEIDFKKKNLTDDMNTEESLDWWSLRGSSHEQKAFNLFFQLMEQEKNLG